MPPRPAERVSREIMLRENRTKAGDAKGASGGTRREGVRTRRALGVACAVPPLAASIVFHWRYSVCFLRTSGRTMRLRRARKTL